jgi:hypothetical protein
VTSIIEAGDVAVAKLLVILSTSSVGKTLPLSFKSNEF